MCSPSSGCDIALMQQAGLKAVRMGHLAWDSYDPLRRQLRLRMV